MKRCLIIIGCAVLAASVASAQEREDVQPPPKPEDNGPSLEVTMKFIKEKLEDKAEALWGNLTIEADPAKCELTDTRFRGAQLSQRKTFSFREVAKIEVHHAKDCGSWKMNKDGASCEDGEVLPDFELEVLMTTNHSVHERYTQKEKKLLFPGKTVHLTDGDFGNMFWHFMDEDAANRLAKAMIHAVELCGGGSKPEPF